MSKAKYLQIAMQQDIKWLQSCAANPSAYMRPIHIALCLIAIRRKSV